MPTPSEPDDTIDLDAPPHARSPGASIGRCLGQMALAVGAIALLSLFAHGQRAALAPVVPPVESAPGPAFVPSVARAFRAAAPLAVTTPRFHLDDPDALEPVRAESPRINAATGQREDVLVQGEFASIEAPYLRLILTETPDSEPGRSLFVILARRAAEAQGLAVIRTGERGAIETKFGAIETLDITLGGEGKRICTGFLGLKPGPVRLDGWLCAPLGQAPEPRAIACALDKVALNAQAWPEKERAFAALDATREPACRAPSLAARDVGSETGSIPNRRTRKNEAKLRQSRQARP